jgi:hypothetical protein
LTFADAIHICRTAVLGDSLVQTVGLRVRLADRILEHIGKDDTPQELNPEGLI